MGIGGVFGGDSFANYAYTAGGVVPICEGSVDFEGSFDGRGRRRVESDL